MSMNEDIDILMAISGDRRERILVEVIGGRTTDPNDTPEDARAREVLVGDVAALKRDRPNVKLIEIPSD